MFDLIIRNGRVIDGSGLPWFHADVGVTGDRIAATLPTLDNALKQALLETIEGGARRVLVDLSHATFIDSTTLGVLMGAVKRLRPAGGELAIACNDPNIRKIFEITLLDRIFEIYPTPDEAIRHLAGESAKLND